MRTDLPVCNRCGCPGDFHQHHRDGTDCGKCGRAQCRTYKPWRPPLRVRLAVRLMQWADRIDGGHAAR